QMTFASPEIAHARNTSETLETPSGNARALTSGARNHPVNADRCTRAVATPGAKEMRMFSNPDELLKFVKDEGVEFIDVRFCDLPGVMQHFNVPVKAFDADAIADGLMFDGSSIRGFQAIHESDMKLIADP